MRKVLLTKKLPKENTGWLSDRYPQFTFVMPEKASAEDEVVREAEIVLGWVTVDMLAKAQNLKWYHSVSAGADTYIDEIDRLRGNDVLVSCSAGVYGVPISEHLLAMMLAFAHSINRSVLNMPREKWGGVPPCRELHGSTVGIIGLGDIGSHLAALLSPFGCEVLAFKRTPMEKPPNISAMLYGSGGLDELMMRADYVCICLPGTPDTRGLIDRRRIGLMKQTSVLLNIGRGYIIDTDALAEALAAGAIAGAGLDVTDPEPLPAGHPLWKFPNVILTPHISGYTTPNWENRITEFFALNLDAYLAGRPLPGAVDRVNKY